MKTVERKSNFLKRIVSYLSKYSMLVVVIGAIIFFVLLFWFLNPIWQKNEKKEVTSKGIITQAENSDRKTKDGGMFGSDEYQYYTWRLTVKVDGYENLNLYEGHFPSGVNYSTGDSVIVVFNVTKRTTAYRFFDTTIVYKIENAYITKKLN